MLRNFFAREAARGVLMLIVTYAVILAAVAALLRMFGL